LRAMMRHFGRGGRQRTSDVGCLHHAEPFRDDSAGWWPAVLAQYRGARDLSGIAASLSGSRRRAGWRMSRPAAGR
jgi:hypothetical protein